MSPQVGDLLRFSPHGFDDMVTDRPRLAVVVKVDPLGFCEILWIDGRNSTFSSEFTSKNFEAVH